MPSDPVEAGRKGGKIGGARNTPAQQAARRRNGFQPRKGVAVTITLDRKPTMTEAELREVCKKYAPKATEPAEPVRIPWDELSQLPEGGE